MKTLHHLILITIFLLPFYVLRLPVGVVSVGLLDILMLATIGVFTIVNGKQWWSLTVKHNTLLSLGLVLFLLGTTGATFFNPVSSHALGVLGTWILLPLLFGYIVFKTKEAHSNILLTLTASGTAVAIISLFYLLTNTLTYDNRLSAFYSSPNQLAMTLAPPLIASFILFIQKRKNKSYQLLPITIGAMSIAIIGTQSLGTIIALLGTGGVVILWKLKNPLHKKISAAILITFLIATLFHFTQTDKLQNVFTQSYNSSLNSRLVIWTVGIDVVKDNWLWGITPDSFQNEYLKRQPNYTPYPEWAVPHPHNLFLSTWLNSGLLGVIGLIILITTSLKNALKYHTHSPQSTARSSYTLFAIAFILYTLLHGLLDTTLWRNDLLILFWITVMLTIHKKEKTNP